MGRIQNLKNCRNSLSVRQEGSVPTSASEVQQIFQTSGRKRNCFVSCTWSMKKWRTSVSRLRHLSRAANQCNICKAYYKLSEYLKSEAILEHRCHYTGEFKKNICLVLFSQLQQLINFNVNSVTTIIKLWSFTVEILSSNADVLLTEQIEK